MRALIVSATACVGALITSACTVVNPPPPAVAAVAPASAPAQQTAYCREYTATAMVDGQPQQTVGTACQQPDGRWQIVGGAPAADTAAPPPQAAPTVAYPTYYYPYPYPYYYPYPAYYGPAFGLGFRFGGGYHHH
jgi:hypothetical protein